MSQPPSGSGYKNYRDSNPRPAYIKVKTTAEERTEKIRTQCLEKVGLETEKKGKKYGFSVRVSMIWAKGGSGIRVSGNQRTDS